MSMADYLNAATPDNVQTLSISPQGDVTHRPGVIPEVDFMDDGSTETYSFTTDEFFIVPIQWSGLSESDADAVIDFYLNSVKGNKLASSFLWTHPTDGYTYVVKFNSPIEWDQIAPATYRVPVIELRVLGYYSP